MTLAKKDPMAIFEELSDLLQEAHDWEDDFYNFAIDNEEEVKIALYAKSVVDGLATHTDKLVAASENAIPKFKEFLDLMGVE
jgi:hypothetical protein